MLFSVSTVRRAAVALAVGCTTALTATAASAAPTTPAHSARPAVIPACARANLRFGVSQGSGAAGSFTYLLRFTVAIDLFTRSVITLPPFQEGLFVFGTELCGF